MADPYHVRMARLLVHYCTGVTEGDYVLISGEAIARPLLLEIYREVLTSGAHPQLIPTFHEASYVFYATASDAQLQYVTPLEKELVERANVSIDILSETNLKQHTSLDPARMAMRRKARGGIMERFMERQATKDLRWVIGPYATQAYAQEAGMSLEEYEAFVYRACHLDKEDPVAEWKRISADQERLCRWLSKRSEFRFVGKDTDLSMSCAGRTWINCNGDNNMPDGEVFTGPVEDSAQGTIRFTYPGIHDGREIEDITLTFKEGRVVSASAAKGGDLLEKTLETDDGSRGIGEIAIGTNYGIQTFTKNMLFDEKMGGTMHLALGAGYPESGSKAVSSLHWDMLKEMRDGGKVYADGELFYENGLFVI
ncbi:MAG: aminopeptidase [Candidatus Methanofastidiosa archaeon]|nr:aminopeptidase [Candidatus Methanofastidiosa archaeon]